MYKILIADDDQDICESLTYSLVKEGYEVESVNDGKEVVQYALQFKPNLILLDVMMPNKNGVEICESLRSKIQFESTLIVFLTAREEDFTQIACFENGADDYIVKPIKPKVLLSRLKALIRRQNHFSITSSNQTEIGLLSIDHDKSLVLLNGLEVRLARKEYELLSLLCSKPGKLFSRKEIFNKVWGSEQMIGDRTIDVHVRKIREKIGDNLIHTVKGLGYKIVVNI